MPNELLATKLAPPHLHGTFVPRSALVARLTAGLARKLTLIAAPAGFGKTTLAAEWLTTHPGKSVWLSLDSSDNDPVRFWRYVFTACRRLDPSLGKSALAALNTSTQPSLETILTAFINELSQLASPCVLVLEDYHLLTSPEVHQSLAFFLDHLPHHFHLLIISRTEPPLPLARLRARNDLTELTAADLRFSPEETQTFLQQTLHLTLPPETIARLDERAEGWVAGLRLLTLTFGQADKPDPHEVDQALAAFSGGHRHVLDYLTADVIASQPESVQSFLLATGFLARLTGSLCEAVTGRADSAALLTTLERANLFLVPLGQDWYRYHPLFAEALRHEARQRLSPSEVNALYAKASRWYEAHGLFNEAIESALAAGELESAAALIERILAARGNNEIFTLRRWAEQIPADILCSYPTLCFSLAMAYLFTSDRYLPSTSVLVEPPLQMAEDAWRRTGDDAHLGQVFALRSILAAWQGDRVLALTMARESLEFLSDYDVNWRGVGTLGVGLEALFTGKVNVALPLLLEARALCEAAQNIHSTLAVLAALAETHLWQGDFDQANQYYQQIITQAIGFEGMADDQAAARWGLSLIAYERNDLATAWRSASEALDLSTRRHDEERQVQVSLVLARIHQARGQTVEAQALLQALVAQLHRPSLRREVQALRARFALAADDLAHVRQWQNASLAQTEKFPLIQQEREAFIVARLRIADGQTQSALDLLAGWQADAHAQGRTISELETLCLKALAYSAQSDSAQAEHALTRALTLAQPKGFCRLFVDEGEPMAALLRAVIPKLTKKPLAAYATTLLTALASPEAAAPTPPSPLLEPLSPQESRVLRLLVAGLSNPEIARELVVSPNTIKTQLKSIYRKLNVGAREEAAAVARTLKLS